MDQLDGHNLDGEGNINKGVPFTLIKLIVLVLHALLAATSTNGLVNRGN
jgi:ABC-type enterochelin transport system permease subunit